MKLEEIRATYYESSGKVSDLVRSLSYSCIAVVWIIRIGEAESIKFDPLLLWVLISAIAALGLDFMHYLTQTLVWGCLNDRMHNKGIKLEAEVTVSKSLTTPAKVFFWAKILCCCAAVTVMIVCLSYQI